MTSAASTADIRHWARSQGIPVGDRGRLSPEIFTAYAASHGSPQERPARTAQTGQTTQTTSLAPAGSGATVAVRPFPGATGINRTI